MGSDAQPDPYPLSTPKLPLFSMPAHISDQHSGMSTPPLQTTVSVPFRWEEQPGKPLPCTDLIITGSQYNTTRPDKTHLDLPPRLAAVTPEANIVTKTSSPTTVLDGPGDVKTTKSVLSSFSFRFTTERRRRRKQRSFDSEGGGADEDGGGGGKRWLLVGDDGFGGFRSSSVRRDSSGLKVKRSRFLAKIYEGFKQVVPWRKKHKMES